MAVFFHIAWILIGGFFIINLFVGVVIDNFNKIKAQEEESGFLSDEQKAWVSQMKLMNKYKARKRLPRPSHPWLVTLICELDK